MSSRHLCRSIAMQSLYEWDFYQQKADLEKILERNIEIFGPGLKEKAILAWELVTGVLKHLKEIDNIISKTAPQWPLEQISLVDRNILRIGVFELLFGDKQAVPPKVAINEAVELAKGFGGENSGRFVNGVLGTIYKILQEEEAKKEKKEEQ